MARFIPHVWYRKCLVTICFVLCFVVQASLFASVAHASTEWHEYRGDTRYETAQLVTQASHTHASTVIVASGANWPDALSACGLAGKLNCPILLSAPDVLSPTTAAEIERLGATTIYLIGGTGALSGAVESQLQQYGDIIRIAGETRSETSLECYRFFSDWGDTALVVSGITFPDALSIAPYAAVYGCPVFVTGADGVLLDAQIEDINSVFEQVIIVGGTGAVSDTTEEQLSSCETLRLWGETRYQTNAKVVAFELENGLSLDAISIASGDDFPDALSASNLCAANKSVTLLVNSGSVGLANIDSFIGEGISTGAIIGGKGAVLSSTRLQLYRAGGLETEYAQSSQLYDALRADGQNPDNYANEQLVFVQSRGTSCYISTFERDAATGILEPAGLTSAVGYVGYAGVGQAREGSKTTPKGVFSLDFCFGTENNPGTSMVYRKATSDSFWVDDPRSAFYNTWHEGTWSKDWNSAERMAYTGEAYRYGVVIGYNSPKYNTYSSAIAGAGSAFFLHVQENRPTYGCVSADESFIVSTIRWLNPAQGPCIFIR